MRRDVIENTEDGMAVVDTHISLFGTPRYTAGVIRQEMRPTAVCRTFGVYSTMREAINAAKAALVPNDDQ